MPRNEENQDMRIQTTNSTHNIRMDYLSTKNNQLYDAIIDAYKARARIIECNRNNKENLGLKAVEKLINKYRDLNNNLTKVFEYKVQIFQLMGEIYNEGISSSNVENSFKKIEDSKNDIDNCINNIKTLKDDTRNIVDRGILYQVKKQFKKIKLRDRSDNSVQEVYKDYCNKLDAWPLIKTKYDSMIKAVHDNEGKSNELLKELNDIDKQVGYLNAKRYIYDKVFTNPSLNKLAKNIMLEDFKKDILPIDEMDLKIQQVIDDTDKLRREANKKKDDVESTESIQTNRPSLKHIPLDVSNVDLQSVHSYVSDESRSNVSGKGKEPESDLHRSISNPSIVRQSSEKSINTAKNGFM